MTLTPIKTLVLDQTTHPNWSSLVQAVLTQVQQAAHEAPPHWHPSQQNRQVRLELASEWAQLQTIQRQAQGFADVLGCWMKHDLAVCSFRVVKGRHEQVHRLLLSGF